jgi:epoxyqueuosine reductase
MPPDPIVELTQSLKDQAKSLGFELVGVTPAVTPARLNKFFEWLNNGYSGQMSYLGSRKDAYVHPSSMLEGCKSLLMLGLPYLYNEQQRAGWESSAGHDSGPETGPETGRGKVARYAQSGHDYHDVIRLKLKALRKWLIAKSPASNARGVVDTAPLLEREFAEAAGRWGSYFFLAALLTDIELAYDEPHPTNHCGSCTACLTQCPTGAIVQPYVLDANRCISHATIESPELPDSKVAAGFSGWVFGCDICQEVCPWNRRSATTGEPSWEPKSELVELDLQQILDCNDEQFEVLFRATPIWRAKRRGLVRNAILLAGSQRLESLVGSLIDKLSDSDELIRAAAAWSLGEIGASSSDEAMRHARQLEMSPIVQATLDQALCKTAALRRG